MSENFEPFAKTSCHFYPKKTNEMVEKLALLIPQKKSSSNVAFHLQKKNLDSKKNSSFHWSIVFISEKKMQKSFFFIILLITLFTFCQSKVFDDRPIRGLEPAAVWRNFYLMTRIPHCSFKEERVRKELIEKFAIENKFHYNVDKKGNAVIHVPATRGYENKPIIILQSHLDMVIFFCNGFV